MDVIIYHNPYCGTSRNTLGLIRNAGIEPHVIEYLKNPPTRALLKQLIKRNEISVAGSAPQEGYALRSAWPRQPGADAMISFSTP